MSEAIKKTRAVVMVIGFRIKRALIPFVALGLIGYGAWLWHPAAGFAIVGALVWLDMSIRNVIKDIRQ